MARNVRLLRDRLIAIVDLVRQQADGGGQPRALVSGGTLAAAAIDAVAMRPLDVDALICRNGRLDLASAIPHVVTPTLLIVASDDLELIRANDEAFHQLSCAKHYDVIPSGNVAAEDARAYRLSAEISRAWLLTYLRAPVAA